MLTLEAPRAVQFVEDFEAAYLSAPPYQSLDPYILPDARKETRFTERRRQAIEALITSTVNPKSSDSHAFMAEWISYISLIDPLATAGYSVTLAPQQLEHGRPGRHGIDLVVARENANAIDPILGINIKLQKLKDTTISDSHRYDPAIQGPSLNMSLGNWAVRTREQEELDIRKWIQFLAIPNAIQTGKIPYLPNLRKFVISRVYSTLSLYSWKWEEYCAGRYKLNQHQRCLVPDREKDLFEEKLFTSYQLFKELSEQIEV